MNKTILFINLIKYLKLLLFFVVFNDIHLEKNLGIIDNFFN